ncbi:uncharacterized protein LOC120262825 [Dioscorea cayenensis subsp. rotundata]|uniref:Uncharacterized protein LOC120262825 n=1 Tax=Dioscorea cayennensis subsp. rotundata TaxID=55577 RepID=A0AB40BH00_DIOCR|nr:uncharacterized protein LOC120262825 [Dioscorea cayenensis subsp. rotundata]
MRYKDDGNIREYVLDMFHLAGKLKGLKIELPEDVLVHLVLISLPPRFSQFEVSYNCQKDKWTLNELISHLVQEEDRTKQHKVESAHLASSNSGPQKKRKYDKAAAPKSCKKTKGPEKEHKELKCFFCKKASHVKKDCPKYRAWRVKKGLPELPNSE